MQLNMTFTLAQLISKEALLRTGELGKSFLQSLKVSYQLSEAHAVALKQALAVEACLNCEPGNVLRNYKIIWRR